MASETNIRSWREAFLVYTQPRVVGMVFLGFAAGLPFLLVFSTLSAWLRDVEVSRSAIGFFSWVGITYSIKVLWAPVIDRLPLPLLSRYFGKRRGWMLLAQALIAAALILLSGRSPELETMTVALLALIVAFGSATQDIVIDAYRIEAVDKRYQGAMAATYVLGYRLALLVAGAGALFVADGYSWQSAYLLMAALMLIGLFTTLFINEPNRVVHSHTEQLEQELHGVTGLDKNKNALNNTAAWFVSAVVAPFVDFFRSNGWMALLILLFIGCYRISDISMGVMANPFYVDKGFSLSEIATVSKFYGFFMSIVGAALGGIMVVRYGILKPLLLGGILVMLTNLLFVYLVLTEASILSLALVISADNLSGGLASSAFIAYLSSLTNSAYTATQYALFSSLMTLPGKVIGGFSGVVVDAVGYSWFFLYSGALGIPAILLVLYLIQVKRREESVTA